MVRSGFGRWLGIDALRLVWLLVIMCVLFALWLCDWFACLLFDLFAIGF